MQKNFLIYFNARVETVLTTAKEEKGKKKRKLKLADPFEQPLKEYHRLWIEAKKGISMRPKQVQLEGEIELKSKVKYFIKLFLVIPKNFSDMLLCSTFTGGKNFC